MLALLVLADAAAKTVQPVVRAQATVRIHRTVTANAEAWRQAPQSQRREIRTIEKDGRVTIVRLIEHP